MKRSFAVLFVLAVVIAAASMVARAYFFQATPSDLAQQGGLSRLDAVNAEIPPFDRVSFGPGTRTFAYRLDAGLLEGAVSQSGILFVAVPTATHTDTGDNDQYRLATLSAGRLSYVSMDVPKTGYEAMTFLASTSPDRLLVSAQAAGGERFVFAVTAKAVVRIPAGAVSTAPYIGNFFLANGDACDQPDNQNATVALYGKGRNGRQYQLLSHSALLQATHGLFADMSTISLTCHSFDDRDFVGASQGDTGVVFELRHGSLAPVSRGLVIASGRKHMLIRANEESDRQPPVTTFDYLEAIQE